MISFQETPPMFWIQRKQPPYYTLGFEWYSIARILPAVSVVIMLLTLALTAVLNGWITRRVSHSISEIAKEAQLIAHNPTIKELTIPKNTIPEIIQLAEALNNMHADINRLMKERELFLAEISHDIRTPLSRLHMVADVLEEDSFIFAKSMLEDIKEVTVILNQTIELGHANAALDELVLKGDINKLLTDIKTKYSRVDVSLDLVLGIMPSIPFKKIALTRLLYNLIDNAIKYGSHDVDVRLVSAMDGTVPTVSVINSVLQQEYASDNDTLIKNYAANTSGLGLKIVERIAKMQGIEVTTIKNLHSQTHTVQLRFSKN